MTPTPQQPQPAESALAARNVTVTLEGDNQIAVRIGDERRTGDTYYLSLDPLNEVEEADPLPGLRCLLQGWLEELTRAKPGDMIHLPFDFSDEFTRWIGCQVTSDEIVAVFGWAEVEGWAIMPSDFSEHSRNLVGFCPDEPLHPQSFYRPRFISLIRRSRAMLQPRRPRRDDPKTD